MSEYGNLTALFGGQPFDPNAHEPSKDFGVLPPGKYTCLVENAELKDTRAGTGKFVKVTLKVLEVGPHENRKLFDNINVFNPSENCQSMGIAQLSALGRAAECFPLGDTNDIIDKVVTAVVNVKKRNDTGEDQNNIQTYEHPSASMGDQAVAPAPAPTGAGVTPVASVPEHSVPTPTAGAPGPQGKVPWNR